MKHKVCTVVALLCMVAERHGRCCFEVCKSLNDMNFGKYEGKVRTDPEYQSEKHKYFKRQFVFRVQRHEQILDSPNIN